MRHQSSEFDGVEDHERHGMPDRQQGTGRTTSPRDRIQKTRQNCKVEISRWRDYRCQSHAVQAADASRFRPAFANDALGSSTSELLIQSTCGRRELYLTAAASRHRPGVDRRSEFTRYLRRNGCCAMLLLVMQVHGQRETVRWWILAMWSCWTIDAVAVVCHSGGPPALMWNCFPRLWCETTSCVTRQST